jgi:hypothetical protein
MRRGTIPEYHKTSLSAILHSVPPDANLSPRIRNPTGRSLEGILAPDSDPRFFTKGMRKHFPEHGSGGGSVTQNDRVNAEERLYYVRKGDLTAQDVARRRVIPHPESKANLSPEKGDRDYDSDSPRSPRHDPVDAELFFLRSDMTGVRVSRKARVPPSAAYTDLSEAPLFSRKRAAPPDSKHMQSQKEMLHWNNKHWKEQEDLLDRYVSQRYDKVKEKQNLTVEYDSSRNHAVSPRIREPVPATGRYSGDGLVSARRRPRN